MSPTTAIDLNKKSLVIITGASQGIGQTISEFIGAKLPAGSKIILIARSEKGLSETKAKIPTTIDVAIYPRDLSKPDIKDFEAILLHEDSYENAIIFHNAGQVGKLVNAKDLNDLDTWRNYYDLNLFSTTVLNSVFVNKYKGNIPNLYIVNISSLCGHKAFPCMALYGSAKAARDLYFSVLALEEPNIVVLKYSPGPVSTAMFNEVIEKAHDAELQSRFKEMKDNKTVLTTKQTVGKLFNLLEKGKFKSGDIVDYFDE